MYSPAEIHHDRDDLFYDTTRWAGRMLAAIQTLPSDPDVGVIHGLNHLASHFLTHICIARVLTIIQCLCSWSFPFIYQFGTHPCLRLLRHPLTLSPIYRTNTQCEANSSNSRQRKFPPSKNWYSVCTCYISSARLSCGSNCEIIYSSAQ